MGAVTHNAAAFCTKSINLTIILFMATHQKPQPIIPYLPSYDYQPKLYNGLSLQEVAHLRREYINPVVSTYYQKPIMIVEGAICISHQDNQQYRLYSYCDNKLDHIKLLRKLYNLLENNGLLII
ncbi:MAG: hypothetical protein F6K25_05760 [Okeania sp. SIO2G4]|uniref:hypothetical protein n=1 Tax=unclassified Okeania TaxID=2634635 RepID=UPI0013BD561D|nr:MULTISPECIES: hypothetical protein [unclassified Okeania]NEP39356.1 hypothetical protein [Okeania sp. SIO2H7]NEP71496.1 hypothetical protein [Okeania sp. SIO2G5]NEP92783.1 hypothetical protein [Okeania sp. SIO2F5]NEQ90251.1 hypothetical protein [Okeania sp. SIO2G4]